MGESRVTQGYYQYFAQQASGAFYWLGDKSYYGSNGGIDRDDYLLAFDASRSNKLYGAASEVRPINRNYLPIIKY